MRNRHFRRTFFGLGAAAAALCALPAAAQQAVPRHYELAEQSLASALRAVSLASGQAIVAPADLVSDKRSPALAGTYTAEDAVDRLLAGSGLRVVRVGDALVIQSAQRDPDAETSREGGGGGGILVTGTRIRGKQPVGSPITVIDRTAIDRSGFATTQQIVQSIPQNFAGGPNEGTSNGGTLGVNAGFNFGKGSGVNLRGLGPTSTLVLLNGDRPPLGGFSGAFADISMIPASAIERIEVVPDGASAIYGSDAVAGVVNIIPRIRFQGAESSFRIGTADGDFEEVGASQLLGTRWSSGSMMIAYDYYARGRLRAADREYSSHDLRAFGGPDRRNNYSNPGTIVAGGSTYAIPRGQSGSGLTAAMLQRGTSNKGDMWFGTDILPQQKRHSVFAAFEQEITPTIRLYGHGLGTVRDFDMHVRPSGDAPRTVPVTNPYYVDPIGTGLPVQVQYSFVRDFGPETQRGKAAAYGGTIGLALDLSGWRLDLHGNWGHQRDRYRTINRPNTARLAQALADPNPATAYNLFGDGSHTNPATIDRVRGSNYLGSDGVAWSMVLRADGPLFALPAGQVRFATGAEYRREKYTSIATVSDVSSLTPTVLVPTLAIPARTIWSGYAEVLVPLFGEANATPFFRSLDLSAAVRTQDYSDFGTTVTPKIGFSWKPANSLLLRGSYGQSFRAPGFNELRQDPGAGGYFATDVPDPLSPSGSSNILTIGGNDPDIGPERARTITLGAEIRPYEVPGLYFGATWFSISYRNRIASPNKQIQNFLVDRAAYATILEFNPSAARVAAIYADPTFIPSSIPQNTIIAIADARAQNLSSVTQAGLDLELGYTFDLGAGRADIRLSGTQIFRYLQALTVQSPATDFVDILGNPVDLRFRANVGWTSERFGFALFANYVDGYVNKTNVLPQSVDAWITFDLQLSYRIGDGEGPFSGLSISLNASNLLDRDPPYVLYSVGSFTNGYDPEQASPTGRILSLQIAKRW